jgi:hypothetical protein
MKPLCPAAIEVHRVGARRTTVPAPRPARLRGALAASVLAASLAAAPAAQAKEVLTPLAVDAGFNAGDAAAKGFTLADTKALKGIQRVAVPVFVVEFITADNVSASTSSFGAAGRSTSSLYVKLLGVGETEFQAITDALHQQFLAELKASGLEVVDTAQVRAAPSYAKLLASGSPAPIKSDTALMLSPPGLGIYGFARMGGGSSGERKGLFGALSDVSAGFSAVGAVGDTLQLGTELDASLVEVRMRVNFAQLADENKGFLGRMAASAKASAKLFPSVDNLMVGVQTGPQRSTLIGKNLLTLSSDAFAEVREKAATKADVAGAVAVGLLKLALGSKDSSSTQELEVVAEPTAYKAVVGQGLAAAGSMVVARMKAER